MFTKKKPFPGDAPDQKVAFAPMGKKPVSKVAVKAVAKKPKGKGASFYAAKAATALSTKK